MFVQKLFYKIGKAIARKVEWWRATREARQYAQKNYPSHTFSKAMMKGYARLKYCERTKTPVASLF